PAEIMAEIARLTPSYGGISYERLEKGGLVWPCPAPDHPGTPVLHVGKFARGLGKFHPVEYVPPAEQPDEQFPLVLSTGRRHFHYHTGTMTLRTGALEVYYPEEYLEVNPADACVLNLENWEKVRVVSRRGEVEVRVCITDRVPAGLVFTSFHFPEVAINKLTNPVRDAIAKIPELKVCAVRI
ncbi:MAG: formate dehydrogenase subunit alpha, partial [Firmicutes bacterium]|nr:formate dehydrogenase subunit alpha [Bacillota bacterium]